MIIAVVILVVKRSSTEYDAGQAVNAIFERSNSLTVVAVVSTGPIGVTPLVDIMESLPLDKFRYWSDAQPPFIGRKGRLCTTNQTLSLLLLLIPCCCLFSDSFYSLEQP